MYCIYCGKEIAGQNICPFCGKEQLTAAPFSAFGNPGSRNDQSCEVITPETADHSAPTQSVDNWGVTPAIQAKTDLDAPGVGGFQYLGNPDGAPAEPADAGLDAPGVGGFQYLGNPDGAPAEPADAGLDAPGVGGFQYLGNPDGAPAEPADAGLDAPGAGHFTPLVAVKERTQTGEQSQPWKPSETPDPKRNSGWWKWAAAAVACVLVVTALFLAITMSQGDGTQLVQVRIEDTLQAADFSGSSQSEKYITTKNLLDELYAEDLILNEAAYNEEHELFSFQYTDGTYGGVSLKSFDATLNGGAQLATAPNLDNLVSSYTNEMLKVVFLNGFENTSFRRDYYEEVQAQWQAEGVHTTVDTLVTIEDLEQLKQYDVFVFSMHGSMYQGSPVLCLNEVAVSDTDSRYREYLDTGAVAKVYTTGSSQTHYWVFPKFFTQCYDAGDLAGKVCWSESCCFFGDDGTSNEVDTAFADALLQSSCEAVLGYRNSVGAEYSRNVMKYSLDVMFRGTEVQFALDSATATQGHTDKWHDPAEGKYEAYPLRYGNLMYILTSSEQPEEPFDSDIQELFDNTYWSMFFGQSMGFHYFAQFHTDGTFTAKGMGSGAYKNGTYTYVDGRLTITLDIHGFGCPSTIGFTGGKDGFTSFEKYPMQVGEDYYSILPDSPDGHVARQFEDDASASQPEGLLSDSCDYILCEGTDRQGNTYELVANQTESAMDFEITVGVIKNNQWLYPMSKDFPFLWEDGLFHVSAPMGGESGGNLLDHYNSIAGEIYFVDTGAFLMHSVNTRSATGLDLYDESAIIFSCQSLQSYTVNLEETSIKYRYRKPQFSSGVLTDYGSIFTDDGRIILYEETSGTRSGWLEDQVYDWYALDMGTLELDLIAADVHGIHPESILSEGLIFATDKFFYNTNGQKVIDLSQYNIDMWYDGDIYFEGDICSFTAKNPLGTEYLITIDKSGNVLSEIEK